ncbi:MAG: hypothetical protein Q8J64_07630 [Thermodesulfovibrionales bacterium]|nr:hypothetical protein [Thermodesulfovibrionales bacterium]
MQGGVFEPLIPVFAFGANVLIQVLSARHIRGLGLLKSIFLGFGAGLLCLLLLEGYAYFIRPRVSADFISAAVADAVTYSALGYGYFHFINLGVTARRIRLLIEVKDSSGLTLEELLSRYNAKEMVSNRLGRLLGSGQVALKDGRYFIGKPVMLLAANAMTALKLLVLGKKSEFD